MEVDNDKVAWAAVSRQVRKERSKIMHAETGGKKMDETVAAMVEIGIMLHISKLIEKHNSDSDFHLNMHTVMSRVFDFEGSEVFKLQLHCIFWTTWRLLWSVDGQLNLSGKHISMEHSFASG